MSKHILIRADAGGSLGSGHVMRMIALAQALVDRGGSATIVSAQCPDGIAERVIKERVGFKRIASEHLGSSTDLAATTAAARASGSSWVVIDGYHFDGEYQEGLRQAGLRVLAVDDYGHCGVWAADAVLNQNIFAPELRYTSELPSSRFLLGTRFALLRREFRLQTETLSSNPVARSCRSASEMRIQRLLITLGGVDADNVTGRILAALNSVGSDPLEVKLLVGPGNPHVEQLKSLAAHSRHAVEILSNVTDMPPLYQWADAVISAGGSTCWEWMFYQRPAAVVCLAENQRPVIAGLVKHRLALDLGWHSGLNPKTIAAQLEPWLSGQHVRPEVPESIAVDALGAMRVAALLDETHLWLRRAREVDAALWFSWANDSLVRANGFHPDPIPWEEHQAWFAKHRQAPDSRLWIGFDLDDIPAGYVRLHKRGSSEWEIGIAVAPEKRGLGVGQRLVQLALQEFLRCHPESAAGERDHDSITIVARIKPANTASLNLFRSVGFADVLARTTGDCCVLICKLRK